MREGRRTVTGVARYAVGVAMLLGTAGVASGDSHGAMEQVATVVVRAEVVAIDRADRHLTLVGPRGDVVDVAVGDEVRNFDQIEVGDQVTVRYTESLAVYMGEPGFLPEAKAGAMVGRAAKGEKPGAVMEETVDIAASVLIIDRKRREVTFLLPGGRRMTTDVDESVKEFDDLELGDTVHARVTRAVAIAVETKGN